MSSRIHNTNGQAVQYLDVATADAALDDAMEAMARIEDEIDRLWHQLLTVNNPRMSDRLVDARRTLHRAARLLDEDSAIG